MVKKNIFLLPCVCFLLLFFNTYARAYTLESSQVGGGSGGAANANFAVKTTLGQGVIGESASGSFKLESGYQFILDSFVNRDTDGDGLVDRWEFEHFNNLEQTANGDPDDDQLTNIEEYELGLIPTDGIADTDADQLLDRWELDNLNSLSSGRADDPDADGIVNYLEFKLGSHPQDGNDRPTPGNYYEYDGLGRIKKIIRIPEQQ